VGSLSPGVEIHIPRRLDDNPKLESFWVFGEKAQTTEAVVS